MRSGAVPGRIKGAVVRQHGEVLALGRCNVLQQPVQLAPAVGVLAAGNGALGAEVQVIELVVAAHDDPPLGADKVDHFGAVRHGVDQVAVDDHVVRLQPFQLLDYRFQRRQIAVNVSQYRKSHGQTIVDAL